MAWSDAARAAAAEMRRRKAAGKDWRLRSRINEYPQSVGPDAAKKKLFAAEDKLQKAISKHRLDMTRRSDQPAPVIDKLQREVQRANAAYKSAVTQHEKIVQDWLRRVSRIRKP
jgi:hypothetical protein